jgi:hypothetical protein
MVFPDALFGERFCLLFPVSIPESLSGVPLARPGLLATMRNAA